MTDGGHAPSTGPLAPEPGPGGPVPEHHLGAPLQPAAPAGPWHGDQRPAYTFLDQPDGDEEDDVLLMPGPQTAWGDAVHGTVESAEPAAEPVAEPLGAPLGEPLVAGEQPPGTPVAPSWPPLEPPVLTATPAAGPSAAPAAPGAEGVGSGTLHLAAPPAQPVAPAPAPAPAAAAAVQQPVPPQPRRPLHAGPPIPDPSLMTGHVPVRSLADRGPTLPGGTPAYGVPVLTAETVQQQAAVQTQAPVPPQAQPQPQPGPAVQVPAPVQPQVVEAAAAVVVAEPVAVAPPVVEQPGAVEPVAGVPVAVEAPAPAAEPVVEQPAAVEAPAAPVTGPAANLAPVFVEPAQQVEPPIAVPAAEAVEAAEVAETVEAVEPAAVVAEAVVAEAPPAPSEPQPEAVAEPTVAEPTVAEPTAVEAVDAPSAEQPEAVAAEQPAQAPAAEPEAAQPVEAATAQTVSGEAAAEPIPAPAGKSSGRGAHRRISAFLAAPAGLPLLEPEGAQPAAEPQPEAAAEQPAAEAPEAVTAPEQAQAETPAAEQPVEPAAEPVAETAVAAPAEETRSQPEAEAAVEPVAEQAAQPVAVSETEAAPQPEAEPEQAEQPQPAAVEATAGADVEADVEADAAAEVEVVAAEVETATEPEPEPEAAEEERPPAAPGYDEAGREAVHQVIRERRDVRNGFRSDAIPHEVLIRVLEAAHTAPSVGYSQPWDFVVIRSAKTRRKMHELAERQREAYADSLPKGRAKQFKEIKIEAILETPVNIVVTADRTRGGRHTLGRHTQPQMAPYSAALAVENLWLAARAEGLGVGWVSFFDEEELVRELGLPEHLEVVAYLCVGYVDAFPDEPELQQQGWAKKRPLSWVVHEEQYGNRALPGEEPHDLLSDTLRGIRPLDAKALGEAWDRQKRMTKPAGSLGVLEMIAAQLSGLARQCPPPVPEPGCVAIFAGDHGVHAQGVTPWPQEVTAQMVGNFLAGGAVVNAFAAQVGTEVCVVDVGVAAELPDAIQQGRTTGLLPRKVKPGTDDMTQGPAMSRDEALRAIEVGIETARDLVAAGNKVLITGDMGIANTTASAALISVFTETDPAEVTGRGTGIDDATHARKIEVIRQALDLHKPDPADPIGVLSAVGGLEHAAIAGFLLGAASLRVPVILDGVIAGSAALVAKAIAPEVLAACIAGHRSAEPGHQTALAKLGLRPLIDLDLRLGEGTGALLALPLVQSAARAMHDVATFDSAGVTEKG
ncbi:nicotinate-nucleotide-dimethylbenzimidazole phosphoribosyltransferase /cob(II)yrinic acid a,c-diamide reductase [Kitasatospora sp. SolWspMP-SS2h]|uniref:nicotinate-nucleotide--dimethylbenzimidazole phosphoribosyltransferase n=1 Tax=Kitasatospora sp. SolWspMP-SS2h TaxID=1305729 RepID=UPI000DB95E30|nr:nicotinate-nucleotide-dimethylbenzimidazole phosphoribosyltransferase /cob(II)yrinic acid a,c-diamide reductase [Kitasatospora sp. SolWspMP-SS2h]